MLNKVKTNFDRYTLKKLIYSVPHREVTPQVVNSSVKIESMGLRRSSFLEGLRTQAKLQSNKSIFDYISKQSAEVLNELCR